MPDAMWEDLKVTLHAVLCSGRQPACTRGTYVTDDAYAHAAGERHAVRRVEPTADGHPDAAPGCRAWGGSTSEWGATCGRTWEVT